MKQIELTGIRFRYKNATEDALSGVTFTIPSGQCFGLLGPNGAGKTTVMRLLCGDLPPTGGSIQFGGSPMHGNDPQVRRQIGVVPQDIAVYAELTGEENLRFWGKLYGVTGTDLNERVNEMLARIGLEQRRHDRVETYSGGMKRRLNFGCGILHRPQVVLLDEPTVGVDPQSRNHLFELVEGLIHDGITVLYSTHYMEEAERLCSRIAVIDHGKVLAVGTRDELLVQRNLPTKLTIRFHSPQAAETAKVSSLQNFGNTETIDADLHITLAKPLPETIAALSDIPYESLQIYRPTLETLFLDLTGRTLREE